MALVPAFASARVRVEVDRDPVVADESFDVTFTTDTRDTGDPDFTPLERDFDILARSSQTSLQIINGRPESGQSWVLSLIAKRSGRIQLPAIAFGKEHSEPLVLDVRPSAGAGADSDVFLTVEATPQPAYVQAQILVTVRLYVGVQVGNATLSDLQATGAVIEKLGDDRRRDEMRAGRNYTVFERRYAVFAERSGTLTLAPVEFAGALLGRGYFGRYKRTASDPMPLTILPSPQDVIPWVPATELTLTEQWPQDPPVFHAGEPLTRTLILSAKGLTAAQLPPLGGMTVDAFKQYVDQPELDDQTADDGVTGVRKEKIAFLPTRPGHYTLPAVEVTWWNTRSESLETARVPEREVDVLPGAASQPAPVVPPVPGDARANPGAPAPAAPVATIGSATHPLVWIAATATLAVAWLLTMSLWWWSVHRRHRETTRVDETIHEPDVSAVRRQLQVACDANDPDAARRALLAWAHARWPHAAAGVWDELRSASGASLARELETLDRALYGRDSAPWSGAALWRSFSAEAPALTPRSRRHAPDTLAPLHP
jgi:hypothetical protein